MSIMSKNVFVVKCPREDFESNFIRKKNSDIINHYEIYQKLSNNDIQKNPPNKEIVDFHIVKRLNNFKLCKKTQFIYILQDKIDQNFISNLFNFFNKSPMPVFFHLLVDEKPEENMNPKFCTVTILEYDKNKNS